MAEARRGQLDRALPRARHRAGVVRGLDLARVLRARARGDLQAGVAERRPGRAAAAKRELLHEGARGREHVDRRRARHATARCARSTTSAGTAATSWCGHDFPREETSGTCRQFTCKYHGWRYGLDGACTFVQQEGEFFDLDKADYGLVPVHCDVWAGFIFVNLDRRAAPVAARVPRPDGHRARRLPVRPDDRALRASAPRSTPTGRSSSTRSRSTTTCPSLHPQQVPPAVRDAGQRRSSAPHFQLDGPHRVDQHAAVPAAGRCAPEAMYPIEVAPRSGLIGPWDVPDIGDCRRA